MNRIVTPCFLSLCLLFLFFSSSCYRNSDDGEAAPISSFTDGFFIVNQGVSGTIGGSISYYDRGLKEIANDIYANKNGEPFDGSLMGMANIGSESFIVQNKLGGVRITARESMDAIDLISGFELPRYVLPVTGTKAYVSQWGEAGGAGSIQVVSLASNVIDTEIPTPGGAERMLKVGSFVYLTHTGGFFLDSVVTKIDIATDQVLQSIAVGISPQSIQQDRNGDIWVLANGLESFTESRPGTLAKIVNDEVVFSLTVPVGSRDLVMDNSGNSLYFINGLNQKIYRFDITDLVLPLAPFSDRPITALGLDPVTNLLVGLDARNFQIEGKLVLFDVNGLMTTEYTLGFVPSYLVF